jgi:5'(3')-deoxyribonucleotidase
MRRRKRILLDVDGPLTRTFFHKACDYLRDEGVPATPAKIDRWDIFASFGASAYVEGRVRERLCLPGLAREFTPNRGVGSFLSALRAWADVYAVTAPLDGSPTWAHDREAWLLDRLAFAPSRVIFARDKRLIGGDAFVDDKLEHLVEWQDEHPEGLAVMWREPHNASADWSGPRVKDYDELREYLEAFRAEAAP